MVGLLTCTDTHLQADTGKNNRVKRSNITEVGYKLIGTGQAFPYTDKGGSIKQ